MDLWRTAAQVSASPKPTEINGRSDLLVKHNLAGLEVVSAKALHVDYSNPEQYKQIDPFDKKLPGPAAMKQLYRGPLPDPRTGIAPPPRWSLLQVAKWPPHTYTWPVYSVEDIRAASSLHPGSTVELSPEAQGIPVPPFRTDPGPEAILKQLRHPQGALFLPHESLAKMSNAALEAAAALSGLGGENGVGARTRRKTSRSASAAIADEGVGDEGAEDGGRGLRKRGRR